MTSVSKNAYIDKLADIVNEYNNTYRSTIHMKPVDAKWGRYIDSQNENIRNIVNIRMVAI